jgi:hypothetical protein
MDTSQQHDDDEVIVPVDKMTVSGPRCNWVEIGFQWEEHHQSGDDADACDQCMALKGDVPYFDEQPCVPQMTITLRS